MYRIISDLGMMRVEHRVREKRRRPRQRRWIAYAASRTACGASLPSDRRPADLAAAAGARRANSSTMRVDIARIRRLVERDVDRPVVAVAEVDPGARARPRGPAPASAPPTRSVSK